MSVHVCVQIAMARTLNSAGKTHEAESILKDVHQVALRAQGPKGLSVRHAYSFLYLLLTEQGRTWEAKELKRKAVKLGCEVDIT